MNRTEYISISSGRLLNEFVRELQLRDIIIEAAQDVLVDPEAEDPEASAIAFANAVNLNAPSPNDASDTHWVVNFSVPSERDGRDLASKIVRLGNERVQSKFIELFEQQLQFDLLSQQIQLEDLRKERENALEDYDRRTSQRLAFLREQAALARSQDLAQSALLEGNTFGRNATVTQIEADVPYYFAGYIAFEKEIAMVESRENKADFIPQLTEINQRIRKVEQDRSVERARAAFQATPLTKEHFTSINFDPRDIQFSSSLRRALVLVGAVMLGGFIGLMVLIMRNALRNRKSL